MVPWMTIRSIAASSRTSTASPATASPTALSPLRPNSPSAAWLTGGSSDSSCVSPDDELAASLAASLAPVLRGNEESGLEKAPKDFGPFRAEAEMTNGRGAMVGLVALLLAEKFTNGAALF